jgi:hypothetical protein
MGQLTFLAPLPNSQLLTVLCFTHLNVLLMHCVW